MGQPLSETISHHLSADKVSINLTRFGQRYYVERVGPLGTRVSDTPHETLEAAKANFAELVERHP